MHFPRRPDLAVKFAFASFLLSLSSFFPGAVWAEVTVKQDLSATMYSVSGNKEKSFYRGNRTSYLYEGLMDFREKTGEDAEVYGNVLYRLTDDRLVDKQAFTLKQLTLGYRDRSKEIVAGDNTANFSDYSLNNSLRGLTARLKTGETTVITLVSGIAAPVWDIFWKDLKGGGTAKRNVWGARAERTFLSEDALSIGLNYGTGQDDSDYFTSSDTYKRIQVFSSDLGYRPTEAVSIKGEIARSFTKAYSHGGLAYDTGSEGAHKLALEVTGKKGAASAQYDRVDPRFETTGGFSAQDLETFQANGNIFLAANFSLAPYLSATRDNLKNTKAATTRRTNPGLNFSWKLAEDTNLSGGVDVRGEKADDDSADNNTNTLTLGLAKNYSAAAASLNFEHGAVRDNVSSDQDRDRNALSLGIGSGFSLWNSKITWDLQERAAVEKHVSAGKSDLLLAHSAGIGAMLPNDLEVRTRLSLSDNNFYQDANDSAVTEYSASASKKFGERAVLFLDYTGKDNRFSGSGNDYSERKLSVKVSCRL